MSCRKHGIKTDKKDGEDSKQGVRKSGPNVKTGGRYHETESRGRNSASTEIHGSRSARANSESSDSETETKHQGEPSYQRKTFSRRQIVSNWNKYDLPEANEDIQMPRGDDFNKLLSSGGDALAQFRFKDEKDWEEDKSIQSPEASRFVSLDCQNLASAIDCIPLYQRLDVPKDSFTENQVILQDLEARKHLDLYSSASGLSVDSNAVVPDTVCEVPEIQENLPSANLDRKQNSGGITLSNLANKSGAKIDGLDFGKMSLKDRVQVSATQSEGQTGRSKVKVKQADEELDFLLTLDTPCVKGNEGGSAGVKTGETTPDIAAVKQDSSGKKEEKSSAQTGSSAKEEDLEDWLDSVLGD